GDQNRVFEVVSAPRSEGDQNVSSQRQLAMIRARTVGDHLTLGYALSFNHNRLLVNASVLVGTFEFRELVDIATDFTRKLSRMMLALDAHNDAFRIDRINNAVALGKNHRT